MKDPEDVIAYKKSVGRLRVHIFLAGLDGEFEQIRGEILRKEPVPDLDNSYALIRREAIRWETLKGVSESFDSTTMIARNRNWQGQTKGNHPKANSNTYKSKFKCTHCNQQGHTKSRCFKLNGYPKWWIIVEINEGKIPRQQLSRQRS